MSAEPAPIVLSVVCEAAERGAVAEVGAVAERAAVAEEVVTAVVRRNGPRVLGYLARRVAVREDAADLYAETIATVWRRRDALPIDEDEALAWMIGIARHMVANGRRTAARRHALVQRLRDDMVVRAARSATGDRGEAVRAALDGLAPADREILRLDAWDQLSGDQIAAVLGIGPAAARQRLARARARLRARLASGAASADETPTGTPRGAR